MKAACSQLCGEKYPAKYKKVVWLLIAIRLCIPISFSLLPQAFTVQVPVYVLDARESADTEMTEADETESQSVSVGSLEIKNIMNTFATAYFEGDNDIIQQHFADAYEWDMDM